MTVNEIDELPFETGQFDGVTCQRVLHHIPDVRPTFAEVERVLKPGGFFYLSDGTADWTVAARVLRSMWKVVLKRRGEPDTLHQPPPGHEALRRTEDFTRLLDSAGFSYELRFFTHVGVRVRDPVASRRLDEAFVLDSHGHNEEAACHDSAGA